MAIDCDFQDKKEEEFRKWCLFDNCFGFRFWYCFSSYCFVFLVVVVACFFLLYLLFRSLVSRLCNKISFLNKLTQCLYAWFNIDNIKPICFYFGGKKFVGRLVKYNKSQSEWNYCLLLRFECNLASYFIVNIRLKTIDRKFRSVQLERSRITEFASA